jgi:hypothetical protein
MGLERNQSKQITKVQAAVTLIMNVTIYYDMIEIY